MENITEILNKSLNTFMKIDTLLKIDCKKVIEFYENNKENKFASFYLFIIYYHGIYLEKNYDKSFYYIEMSANKLFSIALHNLAWLYFIGHQSDNKSLDLEKTDELVELYIKKACYYLKLIDKSEDEFIDKRDKHKNVHLYCDSNDNKYKMEFMLFKYYIFRNDCYSIYCLGNKSQYMEKNIKKAIAYYKLSIDIDNNNHYSLYELGKIYENRNSILSLDYYKKAIYIALKQYDYIPKEFHICNDKENLIKYTKDLKKLMIRDSFKILTMYSELKKTNEALRLEINSLKTLPGSEIYNDSLNDFNEKIFNSKTDKHYN